MDRVTHAPRYRGLLGPGSRAEITPRRFGPPPRPTQPGRRSSQILILILILHGATLVAATSRIGVSAEMSAVRTVNIALAADMDVADAAG
jgi:hypothetical protein